MSHGGGGRRVRSGTLTGFVREQAALSAVDQRRHNAAGNAAGKLGRAKGRFHNDFQGGQHPVVVNYQRAQAQSQVNHAHKRGHPLGHPGYRADTT